MSNTRTVTVDGCGGKIVGEVRYIPPKGRRRKGRTEIKWEREIPKDADGVTDWTYNLSAQMAMFEVKKFLAECEGGRSPC